MEAIILGAMLDSGSVRVISSIVPKYQQDIPTWRIIPLSKCFIFMVIVSPLSKVVPLPNGLFMARKWGWCDHHLQVIVDDPPRSVGYQLSSAFSSHLNCFLPWGALIWWSTWSFQSSNLCHGSFHTDRSHQRPFGISDPMKAFFFFSGGFCCVRKAWGCDLYGCFLKWWYPQNTPKWSFFVGKPMVVGYQHFRKPPYSWWFLFDSPKDPGPLKPNFRRFDGLNIPSPQ